MAQAAICEGMYLGGGLQWREEDKRVLDEQGRPYYEFNEVMPSINSALGYQIQNRMDIAFRPRGGKADMQKATILSKVVMQVADRTSLHWKETQVYGDGLIEQRGYFDVRMSFDKNIKGEIDVTTLDPRDVMPDPDAKTYDPATWADVTISRWLLLDEIEALYGRDARDRAETSGDESTDFGDMDEETERNRFGINSGTGRYDAYTNEKDGLKRYRVIERQKACYEMTKCLVFPESGDIKTLESMTAEQIADAQAQGAKPAKRMRKRIKWIVSTYSTTLHSDYSPYEEFTIVPYFAYFRRGKTRGMVDNAIGPQEALNKAVSQNIHIGLLHLPQKLPRIAGQAFHIAPLSLGINGIERQRAFARPGQPRKHNKLVARDGQADIAQVMLSCAANDDLVVHRCNPPWLRNTV